MKTRKVLKEVLNHFEVYLGTVIFLVMMVLLTIQVFSRYFFGRSFTWTEELGTIMFIWLIYLGSCAAVLEGKHLRIDLFLSMMRGNLKKAVLLFTNVVTMAFCGYIIFPLVKIVQSLATKHSVTPLMSFPSWVAYAIIPVSMALMVIRLVQDSIHIIKSKNIDETIESGKQSIFDKEVDGEGDSK